MDPETLPMPRSRGRALTGLAAALAHGELVLDGADPAAAHAGLVELPGSARGRPPMYACASLGDRDAFLPTDLGVRRGLERVGADGSPARRGGARRELAPLPGLRASPPMDNTRLRRNR